MNHEARSSRPAWSTWQNPVSTKNTKISQTWCCMPIVPANRKAEVGGSLEHGRQAEVIVSQDHATELPPGQQSKILFQRGKKLFETCGFSVDAS